MRWLDGITDSIDELEQTLQDSEGHTSLACGSPWDCKGLETTDCVHESNNDYHLGLMMEN